MTRTAPPPAAVFGDETAIIGHRGLGRGIVAGHRENTLSSFTTAVDLGVSWVEADVRRTADDVLVVGHDAAYPDGARVAEVTAEVADRRGTLRLATLLERLPPWVGVNVDLKSCIEDSLRPPERTTAALLAPVVAEEALSRPVVVSAFDPSALRRLRQEAPRVLLTWLTWYGFPLDAAVAGCAHLEVDALGLQVGSLAPDPWSGTVDPATVARALGFVHGSGRALLVWCPSAGPASLLVEAGVDALVVDEVPSVVGQLRRPG
ncbi:glycerophosphodiester phosphodiesterase [Geodermatophilus sp. URMC 64]